MKTLKSLSVLTAAVLSNAKIEQLEFERCLGCGQ